MKRTDAPDLFPHAPADGRLIEVETWARGISTAQSGRLLIDDRRSFAEEPPSLYLETSVVSYLTARLSRDTTKAFRQVVTRRWWNEHRARHVVYVSEIVRKEAGRGDPNASSLRVAVLDQLPYLNTTAKSHELARRIVESCRLAASSYDDALHVAIAALNGIEVLLTWNCAHLANEHMIPFIRRACEAYGYAAPVIFTPEQLIGACAYGRTGS